MILSLLCLTVIAYGWVLLSRVILSLVLLFKPDWRPPAGVKPLIDAIYGLTEPPLGALRRLIPQPAGVPLDLSFIVLYLIVYILRVAVLRCPPLFALF